MPAWLPGILTCRISAKQANTHILICLISSCSITMNPLLTFPFYPPGWLVKWHLKKNKAVLSGEGADELFGGYTWHHENIEKNRWKNRLKPGKTSPAPFSVEAYNQAMAMGHLRSNGLNNLLTSDYADS